ncbi:uncharacterized protein [Watersipora subatra]|uniref:uncharacterized protein n=1 Tax=Watersipora subatra TaxID=2589382 RepID=UPI00355C91CE
MYDSSYISEGLLRSQNIPRSAVKLKQLTLTTMNHISTDTRLAIRGLKLRGYGESYEVKLPTMITTPEKMEINKSYIPTAQRISSWPHLRDVAKKLPPELNLNIDILLGGDCNAVHLPLEVVASSPETPHARRTVLVFRPKKPRKIRVVLDCSAKSDGKSLNDYLLQGPDQMNNILGIFMRFRTGSIAVTCDTERMFYQFKVASRDRNYLRFLWFDSGYKRVQTYRMNVHIFGATSSPGCATFGLRRLANTTVEEFSSVDFITNNFYVDDGLISTDSLTNATQLIQGAINICKKGNIQLHKFILNSGEFLNTFPETEVGQGTDSQLLKQNAYTHRTIGLQWNTATDSFQYQLNLSIKELTRRNVLSILASVFDPLGLIPPVIIKGKQLLKQCCKMNLGANKSSEFGTVTKAELHAFSDASIQGYGACVYLRLCDEKETINLRNIQITDTYYYTDSQIVLRYLRNEAKRFHVFVSNRVQKIRTMTKPADWYYVPSALNPADHASRGLSAEQLSSSIWTNGPPFLNMQPIQLPKQPDHVTLADLDTAMSEVKKTATTCSTLACLDKLLFLRSCLPVKRRATTACHKTYCT